MENLVLGAFCYFNDKKAKIKKFIDFKKVIIQFVLDDELEIVELSKLNFDENFEVDQKYIDTISDNDWKIANDRYSIIKPILDVERNTNLEINKTEFIKEICLKKNIGYTTIYRWLGLYNTTGLVSSLVPSKKTGGQGSSRLNSETELILKDTIDNFYLNSSKQTKKNTAIECIRRCKNAGVEAPHVNTIFNRINALDKKNALTKRLGYMEISQKVSPSPGKYEEAKFPLDVIQIDHTVLDIMVVSEEDRTSIGRPYITLAIDVFSRMVAGVYISMDPPGALGTGICLSNAILPKDDICAKYDLKSDWPLWGIMKNVHLDNAKEFKGKMLTKAAQEYGIIINWRPKIKTRYGGHIERLIGTFGRKIHTLPGTTFEKPTFRSNYNSEAKATMTLSELEKWLQIQIVDIYHNEKHKGIGTTPLMKYTEGIFGSSRHDGIGLPLMNLNADKVRLDFLPHFERSIQRSGVVIDHIHYYSEIFKNHLYERTWNASDRFIKNVRSKMYVFKRDPRDISKIYFLDEKENRYVVVPYADLNRPPMCIWDYRIALKKSQEFYPNSQVTEDMIFDAYNRLKQIEEQSQNMKKKAKRTERARKVKEFELTITTPKKQEVKEGLECDFDLSNIQPFEFDDNI